MAYFMQFALIALGLYAAVGAVYGLWFALKGAAARDTAAASAPLRVRLLFAPGAAALWPLLMATGSKRGG